MMEGSRLDVEQLSIIRKPIAPDGYSLPFLADNLNDLGPILQAFTASFSMIIISELGDKTFIISAIMSMENSRALVFLASATALILMTMLSVVMGVAVTIIPKLYTHYASMFLFLYFGLKMLHEAYCMGSEDNSEFEEVKRSLEEDKNKNKITDLNCKLITSDHNNNNNNDHDHNKMVQSDFNNNDSTVLPKPTQELKVEALWFNGGGPLILKVFTMIFLAEWGDRSQISTVVLAARDNVIGVLSGALLGHILCTGLAVLAGRLVADHISVKTSKYTGVHSIQGL